MYFVVPGGNGVSYKRFNFSSYLNPLFRRFQNRTPLIVISRPVLGFNMWVGVFIYVFMYLYFSLLTPVDAWLNEIQENREQHMGITCTHLWRREYSTCRHYHSYQVPSWFGVSFWLFSYSITIQCELWFNIAQIWMHWNDIGRNLSIHVYRGWMGISIATIEIQWFAGCAIECILARE